MHHRVSSCLKCQIQDYTKGGIVVNIFGGIFMKKTKFIFVTGGVVSSRKFDTSLS